MLAEVIRYDYVELNNLQTGLICRSPGLDIDAINCHLAENLQKQAYAFIEINLNDC